MQMEKLLEFHNANRVDNPERRQPKKDRRTIVRPDNKFREPNQPRYHRYTPLVSNKTKILEVALNANLICTPRRMPTPPNANTTKHYRYHRNFGHTAKDCFTLKDKIDELIQAGHLRRFVKRE